VRRVPTRRRASPYRKLFAIKTARNALTATLVCCVKVVGNQVMNVPYLHPRLPDGLKWRILAALLKLNERPHPEETRSAILGALGAMNLAAAYGVSGGREAIVASLLVGMVSDIEAIANEASV
jgi:hypothetical protein